MGKKNISWVQNIIFPNDNNLGVHPIFQTHPLVILQHRFSGFNCSEVYCPQEVFKKWLWRSIWVDLDWLIGSGLMRFCYLWKHITHRALFFCPNVSKVYPKDRHRTTQLDWGASKIWLVVWNMAFVFPYIGNNNPNWLVFFRGVGQPPTRMCFSF